MELEFEMPMTLDRKSAWILVGMLLIAASSTLAGCASMPLADSKGAENAGPSKDVDGSISAGRPIADVGHVVRDVLLDPASVPVSIFSLFGLPIVLIGTVD